MGRNKNAAVTVGTLSSDVINALELTEKEGMPIFLGKTNVIHMKNKHPAEFEKYFDKISEIIDKPDYVGKNLKDNSLEYVKEYKIDDEFVKVAVRVSSNNIFYARSLYILNKNKVNNYIDKGRLVRLDKN